MTDYRDQDEYDAWDAYHGTEWDYDYHSGVWDDWTGDEWDCWPEEEYEP